MTQLITPGSGPESERWFVDHGLPWFVPERRESARRALRSRRLLVGVIATVAVALAVGAAAAWLTGTASLAPATLLTFVVVAALGYAGRELGAWPIARWAVRKTMGSLHLLFPMVTRALPLLLLFITFLFINTEVWQVSSHLDGGVLWLAVLLFAALAVTFLLARLPEELDQVDDAVQADQIVATCRHTPLAAYAEQLAAQMRERHGAAPELTENTQVHGMEKANLVLVLLIAQALQVVLLAVSVFAFFLLFGAIVMTRSVQESWVGQIHALPFAENLSSSWCRSRSSSRPSRASTSPSTPSPTRPTGTSSSPASRPSWSGRSPCARSTSRRGRSSPGPAQPPSSLLSTLPVSLRGRSSSTTTRRGVLKPASLSLT